MNWFTDRTKLFLLGGILAILAAGTLAGYTVDTFWNSLERVHETRQTRFELERLLNLLKDAQRGARGFLLTGEERFLTPYYASRPRIGDQLDLLRHRLRDEPGQLRRLARIEDDAQVVLEELEEVVRLRRTVGLAEAAGRVGLMQARFDEITYEVTRVQEAEETRLVFEEADLGRKRAWALGGMLLLSLLSIGAFLGGAHQARRAQREADLAHGRLRGIIDSSPDPIAAFDADLRLTAFNGAYARHFERTYGRSPSIGASAPALLTGVPLFRRLLEDRWGRTLQGEAFTVEQEVPDPEAGTRFLDVHHYPVYAENGHVIGGATREVDVTERLRLTRALEEREAFLECIFGGTDTAICALDVGDGGHGRVADVNPRFEHLMRVRAEEVRGLDLQPFLSNLPADAAGPFRAHVRRCLETRTSLTFELPMTAGGAETWWLTRLTPLLDDDGRTYRLVSTSVPITELKEAQWALNRSQRELEQTNRQLQLRNRELQDFAYVASHDLQEPLRKICAFSDLLQSECAADLNDDGRFYLSRMASAAERMSALIRGLLDFSRVMTRGQPFAPVDLGAVLQGVLDDLDIRISETGARIEAEPLGTIDADATQMQQLFLNLLTNALKFYAPGTTPVVRVRASVEASPDDGTRALRLEVQDEGIGFEMDYADRIFSPFQRLHSRAEYEGTGMGLSICRRIAERHGGRIYATSAPGQGSTFTVLLPVRQVPLEAPHTATIGDGRA